MTEGVVVAEQAASVAEYVVPLAKQEAAAPLSLWWQETMGRADLVFAVFESVNERDDLAARVAEETRATRAWIDAHPTHEELRMFHLKRGDYFNWLMDACDTELLSRVQEAVERSAHTLASRLEAKPPSAEIPGPREQRAESERIRRALAPISIKERFSKAAWHRFERFRTRDKKGRYWYERKNVTLSLEDRRDLHVALLLEPLAEDASLDELVAVALGVSPLLAAVDQIYRLCDQELTAVVTEAMQAAFLDE